MVMYDTREKNVFARTFDSPLSAMATKSFSAYTARPTHCVFRQVAANTGCESIVGVSFSIFE